MRRSFADRELPPAFAGRGLNPRPERSTHAKTGEQRTKKQTKRFISGDAFPDLELQETFSGGGAFRSGVQPPTGSELAQDRPRTDSSSLFTVVHY